MESPSVSHPNWAESPVKEMLFTKIPFARKSSSTAEMGLATESTLNCPKEKLTDKERMIEHICFFIIYLFLVRLFSLRLSCLCIEFYPPTIFHHFNT
jgi:hypothetical protein